MSVHGSGMGGGGGMHMSGSGHGGGAYAGGYRYGGGGGVIGGGANGGAHGGAHAGAACCGAQVGCGNTGCGACDQEEATLSYVGSGRGSYTAQSSYKYVGAGCGEMEYVAPPAKPNCFCIVSFSLLLCLLPLLLYWLMGSNTSQTTPLPYDCNAGLANAQMGWSVGKKAWCCDHTGQGC